jgi:hypothetical protein
MKKLLALLCFAAIAFAACNKDDDDDNNGSGGNNPPPPPELVVEKKNFAALIDFSEDWCPPCGSYGGPTFDSALSQEGIILTGIKVYGSSNNTSLNAAVSDGWANGFNVTAIPSVYVNNTKTSITTSIGSNYNSIVQKANAFVSDSVRAAIALKKTLLGDSVMEVKTKVKFYVTDSSNANYTLGVYLMEDDVIANQSTNSGSDPDYVHRNLLRIGNASTYLGTPINSSADIVADQEFDAVFNLPLNPNWNTANLKVIAVIWQNGTGTPKVINSRLAP